MLSKWNTFYMFMSSNLSTGLKRECVYLSLLNDKKFVIRNYSVALEPPSENIWLTIKSYLIFHRTLSAFEWQLSSLIYDIIQYFATRTVKHFHTSRSIPCDDYYYNRNSTFRTHFCTSNQEAQQVKMRLYA